MAQLIEYTAISQKQNGPILLFKVAFTRLLPQVAGFLSLHFVHLHPGCQQHVSILFAHQHLLHLLRNR